MNHHDTAKEIAAATGTVGSWAIWGWSLTQINTLLTTISLIAAICASIAATVYYVKHGPKK